MDEAEVETAIPQLSIREAAVAHFAFPVVMTGGVAFAIALMQSGVDPLFALIAAQIPSVATVIVLERLVPYHEEWNRSHGDLLVDAKHIVTITVFNAAIDPLLRGAGLLVAAWISLQFSLTLWPESWPLLVQLALALVFVELWQYWVHRWQHEVPFLWRFHALHHSAPRLYWLNAARFHPLDLAFNGIGVSVGLAALGAGVPVLALWLLVSAVHGIFQHANIPVRIGPLNWIFSMAELHRWHHSRRVRESNTNYGQTLSIWDTVFGTRYLPKDREPPRDIGLTGLDAYPMTWWAQEIAPLRWAEIEEASAAEQVAS
jgi:sterol desaturase/sphingolipid hydroxylase (fatty acid hydroxylase superfamily)